MIPSSPYRSFVLLCLVSLVLWGHTIVATFGLALRDDAYTHILLIIPVSIALIFTEWRSRKAQPETNFLSGLALLLLAILIGFIGGRWRGAASLPADMQLSLGMLAVVTWWIGSFVCCFGTRISRICVFPLCFLLWLVPLPEFALNHIVTFLQRGLCVRRQSAFRNRSRTGDTGWHATDYPRADARGCRGVQQHSL